MHTPSFVCVAVFMRDASQVFKRIENRNNYSPVISRWGKVSHWVVTVIPSLRLEMKLYGFDSYTDYEEMVIFLYGIQSVKLENLPDRLERQSTCTHSSAG
jgi:hypothetical protein